MGAWRAHGVLSGLDEHCAAYIAAESSAPAAPAGGGRPDGPEGLGRCVERGRASAAAEAARRELAAGADALDLINSELIPALDRVGRDFESGTLYLPQLLMAAEAAGAAFGVLKGSMGGVKSSYDGKIVIATVKGDIHDIGKNIVRTLLENYGFEVEDLGRDVPPEAVLAAARRPGVRLVGLSALMTTTVAAMAETIALLRRELPDIKIVVGGAVLNAEYAEEIGSDYYAPDAMSTVHIAQSVCQTASGGNART